MKFFEVRTRKDNQHFDVVVAETKRDAVKAWMDHRIRQFLGRSEKWVKRHGFENYQHMLGELTKIVRKFPGKVVYAPERVLRGHGPR